MKPPDRLEWRGIVLEHKCSFDDFNELYGGRWWSEKERDFVNCEVRIDKWFAQYLGGRKSG